MRGIADDLLEGDVVALDSAYFEYWSFGAGLSCTEWRSEVPVPAECTAGDTRKHNGKTAADAPSTTQTTLPAAWACRLWVWLAAALPIAAGDEKSAMRLGP